MPTTRFRRFAVATLAFTMAVILWGAYVRATGSGAGCGSHWPTCNGDVIPRAPNAKTLIEFTHRATSGVAFLLVLAQAIWARRAFGKGHAARRAAAASLVLMILEALVGGGLVIFKMVADETATVRGVWMGAHLVNTFALLAAMGLTVWHAAPRTPLAVGQVAPRAQRGLVLGGLALSLLVAVTGAIAALGDTLFPARSLAEGIAHDLSPAAHVFVRLRVLHPALAVVGAIYLAVCAVTIASDGRQAESRRLATLLGGLVVAQMAVGVTNLVLLAPIPMQLVHLFLADLLWLTLVALTAAVLRRDATAEARVAARPAA